MKRNTKRKEWKKNTKRKDEEWNTQEKRVERKGLRGRKEN